MTFLKRKNDVDDVDDIDDDNDDDNDDGDDEENDYYDVDDDARIKDFNSKIISLVFKRLQLIHFSLAVKYQVLPYDYVRHQCPPGTEITNESECRKAAQYLGRPGQGSMRPDNKFRSCSGNICLCLEGPMRSWTTISIYFTAFNGYNGYYGTNRQHAGRICRTC